MSSGKVLLGVLAGIATGALIGVLFAPEKGSTTRKKIQRKGDDYVDDLKDKLNEFLEMVKAKAGEETEEVKALAKNGKSKLEKVISGMEV